MTQSPPNMRLQRARLRACLLGGNGSVHHCAAPKLCNLGGAPLKRGVGWTEAGG